MQPFRHKILIIPRTYPGRLHPLKGVFVQKQVQAQTAFDDIAVLNVISDPDLSNRTFDCSTQKENGCIVVRVFYRKNDLHFPWTALPVKLYRFLKASRIGYHQIVKNFGIPDLVHVHMALPGGFLGLWLNWSHKVPYLITEHLTDYMDADGSYQRASFWYRLLTRLVCRSSQAITAVSPSLLKALTKHGLVVSPGHVIANVIDSPAVPRLKKESRETKTLLTACLLNDEQKNLSGLLAAFSQLLKTKPNIRLLVAGDGPDRQKLETLAKELVVQDRVTFLGLVAHEQMAEYWKQTDLYVMNSRFESFSVATAEAMLHGIPVVVTACGGPEHFVTPDTGKVVAVDDEQALAQGMAFCLDHPDRFNPAVIQKKIQDLFSGRMVGQQYHGLYATLMTSWPVGFSGERITLQPNWLVLDVGSGHNPNRRADILLERELEASVHRSGARATIPVGKHLVIGDAQAMPFKAHAFDYIVASHIAEHIPQPDRFLQELQRIGSQGYIETPGPLSELLLTEPYHLWVIRRLDNKLWFKRKKRQQSAGLFFYNWYYLNQERYGHTPWRTGNPLIKLSQALIVKVWKHAPGSYTRLHWKKNIPFEIKDWKTINDQYSDH